MFLRELECLAHAGEHAEAEHIDLEDAERIEVVLVPFDEGALRHGAVADRHDLIERTAGDDEAADMLGEVTRKRLDRHRQRLHFLHARAGEIDACLLEIGSAHSAAAHSPDRGGKSADGVFREPEYLADLADGRAAAIGNDGRGNAGMVAPIVLIDVLDHLLAPLVLEIDIDVGRLVAIGGDETLEQKAAVARIDIGDAQAVADRRVRGRAAALTKDVPAARIFDNGMDGEKIRRVIELADQSELMVESLPDIVRNAFGIARGRAFPREMDERFLRAREARAHLIGIFITQFVEREGQRLVERQGLIDRLRRGAEETRHLGRRLEIALGIDGKAPSRLVDRQVLADAGEHVLELAPVGMVIEHVIDGDEGNARLRRRLRALRQSRAVVAAVEHACREPHAAAGGLAQKREQADFIRAWIFFLACHQPQLCPGICLSLVSRNLVALRVSQQGSRRKIPGRCLHHDELETLDMLEEVIAIKDAIAFLRPQVAAREQPAEPPPGRTVARIGEDIGRAVGKDEACAGMIGERQLLFALDEMGTHHAGNGIAIAQPDAGEPDMGGLEHQLLGMRGPAQEREIRGDGELKVGRGFSSASNANAVLFPSPQGGWEHTVKKGLSCLLFHCLPMLAELYGSTFRSTNLSLIRSIQLLRHAGSRARPSLLRPHVRKSRADRFKSLFIRVLEFVYPHAYIPCRNQRGVEWAMSR